MARGLACIAESVLIWDVDYDGHAERRKREQYRARRNRRKLQKEQRLEARRARHSERRRRTMMSTEQRQILLQWRREARHRTESIAENQPLEIPSVEDGFLSA